MRSEYKEETGTQEDRASETHGKDGTASPGLGGRHSPYCDQIWVCFAISKAVCVCIHGCVYVCVCVCGCAHVCVYINVTDPVTFCHTEL